MAQSKSEAKLCATPSVLISVSFGVDNHTHDSCAWVDGLLGNALSFSRPSTRVVVHVSDQLVRSCLEDDLVRWTLVSDRVAFNPVHLPTSAGHGSVLYAHMLNAKLAIKRWPGVCCCSMVLQASNMLWTQIGWEQLVARLKSSVGNVRQHTTLFSIHMREALNRTRYQAAREDGSNEINARFYANLTGEDTQWPPDIRFEYHEGSFYPMATVLRFTTRLETFFMETYAERDGRPRVGLDAILDAGISPEEWWLQAYVRHHEGSLVNKGQPQQLCYRVDVSKPWVTVPRFVVQRASAVVGCSSAITNDSRSYAVKRFVRDVHHPVTALMLNFTPPLFDEVVGREAARPPSLVRLCQSFSLGDKKWEKRCETCPQSPQLHYRS